MNITFNPREGGGEPFAKEMSQRGNDALIDELIKDHTWHETEWEW